MRLIQGRNGWWCIGPSGTALVPENMVHGGELTDEGRAEVDRMGLLAPRRINYYSLTVLTSTNCNLGCPYCFQNTGAAEPGKFNPPRIKRAVLSPETIGKILTFTRARMADLDVSRLYVLLFGGEPLLNPIGCREVLRRCAELGEVTGSMISNGVLLRKRLASQLYDLGMRAIQITLDGPQEVHDTVRTTRNGGATFDTIVANVAAAQEATGLRFTFRINLTPQALSGIEPLIERLAGAVDPYRTGLGITPVMDYGWGFDDLVNPSHRTGARIVAAYEMAQGLGFRISKPVHIFCEFCGAERGRYGAVVNADGTLYSCWESVGRPGYEVGSITAGYNDYAPDKWVACGSFATSTDAPETMNRFRDEIDASLLDLLRRRKMLARAAT